MKREDFIAPERYNLTSEIEKHAVANPNKLALKWENEQGETREITYGDLIRHANQIGNALLNQGLEKGDKVLVMVPRLIEAYEVYLGTLKAGLVVIPSSEMLCTKDLQYRISHGEVKAVIAYELYVDQFKPIENIDHIVKFVVGQTEPNGWINLEKAIQAESDVLVTADTSYDDTAFLSYTSRTTENPKGVVHTHGWGYAHLHLAAKTWLCGIEENDLVWATAGPGWQKWIWSPFLSTLSILSLGATGFVYYGRFDPEKYLQLLSKYEVNVLCFTPTEYRLMAKVPNIGDYKLPHLRSAVSVEEPLNREVIDTFEKYFNIQVTNGTYIACRRHVS
jgi:acetyl-CoA synthetase